MPIPFQHRARAVNPYPTICLKYMCLFHYFLRFTNAFSPRLLYLVRSPIPCHQTRRAQIAKALHTLAYFISVSLIVHPVCAPVLKDFTSHYTLLVEQRYSLYLTIPVVLESYSVVSLFLSTCVPSFPPRVASSPSPQTRLSC